MCIGLACLAARGASRLEIPSCGSMEVGNSALAQRQRSPRDSLTAPKYPPRLRRGPQRKGATRFRCRSAPCMSRRWARGATGTDQRGEDLAERLFCSERHPLSLARPSYGVSPLGKVSGRRPRRGFLRERRSSSGGCFSHPALSRAPPIERVFPCLDLPAGSPRVESQECVHVSHCVSDSFVSCFPASFSGCSSPPSASSTDSSGYAAQGWSSPLSSLSTSSLPLSPLTSFSDCSSVSLDEGQCETFLPKTLVSSSHPTEGRVDTLCNSDTLPVTSSLTSFLPGQARSNGVVEEQNGTQHWLPIHGLLYCVFDSAKGPSVRAAYPPSLWRALEYPGDDCFSRKTTSECGISARRASTSQDTPGDTPRRRRRCFAADCGSRSSTRRSEAGVAGSGDALGVGETTGGAGRTWPRDPHQDLPSAWSRPCSVRDQKKSSFLVSMSTATQANQLLGVNQDETRGRWAGGSDQYNFSSSLGLSSGGLEERRDPLCDHENAYTLFPTGLVHGVNTLEKRSSTAERRGDSRVSGESPEAAGDYWRHLQERGKLADSQSQVSRCSGSHQRGLTERVSRSSQVDVPQDQPKFGEETREKALHDCRDDDGRDVEGWRVPPFRCLYRYFLPPAHLTEKLVRVKMGRWHLVGLPQLIVNEAYERNAFEFCFAFVYDEESTLLTRPEDRSGEAAAESGGREAMMSSRRQVHSMLGQVAERVNRAFRSVEEKCSWLSSATVPTLVATVRSIVKHFELGGGEMGAKIRPSSSSGSQRRHEAGSVPFPLGQRGRKEEENCRIEQVLPPLVAVPHQNVQGFSLGRRGSGASCLRLLLPGLEDRGALAIHLPFPSRSLLQEPQMKKLPSPELRQSALIDFKRLNPACLPPQRGRAFWARVPVPLIDLKRLMQVMSSMMLPMLPPTDYRGRSYAEQAPVSQSPLLSPLFCFSSSTTRSPYRCSSPSARSPSEPCTPLYSPYTSSACARRHPGRQDEFPSSVMLGQGRSALSHFIFSVDSSPHTHPRSSKSSAYSYFPSSLPGDHLERTKSGLARNSDPCNGTRLCSTSGESSLLSLSPKSPTFPPLTSSRQSPVSLSHDAPLSPLPSDLLRPQFRGGRQRRRSSLLSPCERNLFGSQEKEACKDSSLTGAKSLRRVELGHRFERTDRLREGDPQTRDSLPGTERSVVTCSNPYRYAGTVQSKRETTSVELKDLGITAASEGLGSPRGGQTGHRVAETSASSSALQNDPHASCHLTNEVDSEDNMFRGTSMYLSRGVKRREDPDPASYLMDGTLYHLFPFIDGTRSVYEIAAEASLPKRLVKTIMTFLAEEGLVAFVDKFDMANRYRLTSRFGAVWRLSQFRRLAPYYVTGRCPPQNAATDQGDVDTFSSHSSRVCCRDASRSRGSECAFGKAQEQDDVPVPQGRRRGLRSSTDSESLVVYCDVHSSLLSQNPEKGLFPEKNDKLKRQTRLSPLWSSGKDTPSLVASGISPHTTWPILHGTGVCLPDYSGVAESPNIIQGVLHACPSLGEEKYSERDESQRSSKVMTEERLASGSDSRVSSLSSVRSGIKPQPVPLPILVFLYSRLTEFGCSPQPAGCPLMVFLKRYGTVLNVLKISVAHFIVLGCIFGFVRRVHEHPVFVLLKNSRKAVKISSSYNTQEDDGGGFRKMSGKANATPTEADKFHSVDGKEGRRLSSPAEERERKSVPKYVRLRGTDHQPARHAGFSDESPFAGDPCRFRRCADAEIERSRFAPDKGKTPRADCPAGSSDRVTGGVANLKQTAGVDIRLKSSGICGSAREAAGSTARRSTKGEAKPQGFDLNTGRLLASEEVAATAARFSEFSGRDAFSGKCLQQPAEECDIRSSSRAGGRLSAETIAKIAAMCNGGSSLDEILVRFQCETKGEAISLVVRAARARHCKVVWLYR